MLKGEVSSVFLQWKLKVPVKAICFPMFVFFNSQNQISLSLFYPILSFFTATFFPQAGFWFFFSKGRKNPFHKQKSIFLAFIFNFNGKKMIFFHGHRLQFNWWICFLIFHRKCQFSRILIRGFLVFFAATFFFHGHVFRFSIFLHGYDFTFHGIQKTE